MKRILITGAAGFIGHHVVEHLLRTTPYQLVFLDRLDCSGNLNRITDISCWEQHKTRCTWVCHDLRAPINDMLINQIGHNIDVILHLAASTHVDRSIADPMSFVLDNVVGTANILDYARLIEPEAMLYFSTDEVFGPAPPGVAYREWDRYKSANPYAATKAGAEELCVAYHNTYRLPVYTSHTMNVCGERQHPEKFIPSTIRKVRDGETVIIHADKTKTIAGSRYYIHARNVADGIMRVLEYGVPGEKYNIVGEREVDNLTLAKMIAAFVGKPLKYEMVNWHESRPGHDLRYALDGTKMAAMGWMPPIHFEDSLKKIVAWSLNHPQWL